MRRFDTTNLRFLSAFGLLFWGTAGCSSKVSAPEPLPPAEKDNLLAPLLSDGIPTEIQPFNNPEGAFVFEKSAESHLGSEALFISGDGNFGGVNIGRAKLEGRKSYIASAYVNCTEGSAYLKFDYYQNTKHLGSTQSMPAKQNGWQQLTVMSQRSRYPSATHVAVVAVCRGKTTTRYDDFSLVTD